ncbi:MAG: hypothetical protein K2M76_05095, partial [Muribaculaceae bacterium]|nr:hypothetical protein [Muribaculaceae bacterium]
RVVGNDISGNISKYIMVQDSTAALGFSIDAYDLYESYHIGQEVVIDLTGMHIGKFNRQLLIGQAEWYAQGNAWEAGRMPLATMQEHAQVNGLVDMSLVDTLVVTIPELLAVTPDSPERLRLDQCLVKFENVFFEQGGTATFAPYHENNVVHNIMDSNGNSFPTYNSGYANFYTSTVPAGYGTVCGILSYVGSAGWRLTLREYSDCVGFDPDAEPVPDPNKLTFKKTASVSSGKSYALVASEKQLACPLADTYNYGYLPNEAVTVSNDGFSGAKKTAFTLTAVEGGYTIQDRLGRYYYMTGTYNSFNVSTTMPAEGAVWTVTFLADGTAQIINATTGKTVQYDSSNNRWAAMSTVTGICPVLYEAE